VLSSVEAEVLECLSDSLPNEPVPYLARSLALRPTTRTGAAPHKPDMGGAAWFKILGKARGALAKKNAKVFEDLLHHGLPVAKHPGGTSVVCLAAAHGDLEALRMLYDKGANLSETIAKTEHKTISAIELAASMGHVDAVAFLLEKGVCFGRSLHTACEHGHLAVANLLLSRGAHPGVRIEGQSAVTLCVLEQRDDILRALIQWYDHHHRHHHSSADEQHELMLPLDDTLCETLSLDRGSNLLHVAAKNALIGSVRTIMSSQFGRLAQIQNSDGKLPFEVADVAIKPFINPNYLASLTILRRAAIGGAAASANVAGELTDLFRQGKGDSNAQDVRGWTALMAAAIANDGKSCRLLLDHGCNWTTLNRNGFSALFWAHAAGSEEVIALLESEGATLTAKDQQGLGILSRVKASNDAEAKSLVEFRRLEGGYRMAVPPKGKTKDVYFDGLLQRMMDDATSFGEDLSSILPPGYEPAVSLEDSILNLDTAAWQHDGWWGLTKGQPVPVVQMEDKAEPGEGDFDTWKQLIEHSRLFVQERIACGDPLHPAHILALHLYTIPCNLFRFTNKSLRDKQGFELFRDFAWYLREAISVLTSRSRLVFRGLFDVVPRKILGGKEVLVWPSFSSTSWSHHVACSFMYRQPGKGGIVFKISARNCKEIANYSYKPLERELLLPPLTSFDVKGVYELTEYNIKYGSGGGQMDLVDMEDITHKLHDYDTKFVMVQLEERQVDVDLIV